MKTYKVSAVVTISIQTEVEAESEKEALEVADGRPMCGLMDPERLGQSINEYWFHSGEIDGAACKLHIED